MSEFIPTACNLCYANCGILAQVEDGHIVKVRGDKNHPVSKGYTCNKAARIDFYQNGRDRLSSPLRKKPDGTFEEIDWETAITEVAAKLSGLRDTHGGDKIMYYGGGGQGNHLGGAYSGAVRAALGMRYHSNALAQEKTGLGWVSERTLGGMWHGDFDHCDVALIIGKNPWQSNGIQRARIMLRDLSKDPDKTLIIFDPRKSESAELADIHLAVKPGTDVWCIAAILGYLMQNDLVDQQWLAEHTEGYDRLLNQLRSVPVQDYADFAGIPMSQIEAVAQAMASTNRIAVYEDLGIEMSPNSTLCSYLNVLLFVLRGAFDVPGGMHLISGIGSIYGFGASPGVVGDDGYEREYQTTPVSGARIVTGLIPCNAIPEEILTDHPDRIRGMIIESANPAHSLADSAKFRDALTALDTLVVIDVAMTETAQLADYVLPAASQYEKFEATFFNFEYPENFFHLRHPLLPPRPGTLPEPEIHSRLVEALGVFEPEELAPFHEAVKQGIPALLQAILQDMPRYQPYLGYIMYRVLGPTLPHGAASAAMLIGSCLAFVERDPQAIWRAGFEGQGPMLGINLFMAMLEAKSGLIISSADVNNDPTQWRKPGGKIQLQMSEMLDDLEALREYRMPERTDEFPLLLAAGERRLYTANTIVRDPDWRKSNNPTSLTVNPIDANALGITDAATARLVTKRGSLNVLVEFDDRMQPGTMSLPNGLGLNYPDHTGVNEITGTSTNELTDLEDRDKWVGTPWHKHVRARLEPLQ
ncbi:MAG: molybdopterin-dependent oxidoreductase [Pseudomonadota bacterium]